MNTGALVWIIVFVASAVIFFTLAVVIAVLGFRDLKSLLSRSEMSEKL